MEENGVGLRESIEMDQRREWSSTKRECESKQWERVELSHYGNVGGWCA